eukprot:CAMPEP_0205803470 /NCGR_PEP_ID=MMETSP0205-20121125/6130_1 /ASSEMBLY_ACC=CAM_ASM_000278 /TAXON_ID=36767 /ORGANISM="Euplotes focardii, Strain TN1" /LENGTH=197 /DNA_ID=CAMNT_0053071593 /DNA_START=668 /DNA_END=1261 /DNA_ORIENTATION=-
MTVDVEKEVSELGDGVSKVFNLIANNEQLPYPDSYFDLYLSSLSMMIVSNHHNQLSEAYRVLEEGGTAGFTVWGRKENSSFFTFFPEVCKSVGIELPTASRTNFHLGNKESLVKDVKDAGFKSVKAFHTQINPNIGSAEENFSFITNTPGGKPIYDKCTEEQRALIKDKYFEEFNTRFGPESTEFMTWEILIVVAKK